MRRAEFEASLLPATEFLSELYAKAAAGAPERLTCRDQLTITFVGAEIAALLMALEVACTSMAALQATIDLGRENKG